VIDGRRYCSDRCAAADRQRRAREEAKAAELIVDALEHFRVALEVSSTAPEVFGVTGTS
jgi:hypothetical protein